MSKNNLNSVTPVWSTSFVGNAVDVLKTTSRQVPVKAPFGGLIDVIDGDMYVRISVHCLPANMTTEDLLYMILDTLVDRINAFRDETTEIFEAQDIRLHDRFNPTSTFKLTGPSEYTGKIAWRGDIPKYADYEREMAFLTRRGV